MKRRCVLVPVLAGILLTTVASCSLPGQSSIGDPRGQGAPGGETTVKASRVGAFSQPAANLDASQIAVFQVGDRFFTEPWSPAGEGPADQDGLGPTFLSASCEGCHPADGRGNPPGAQGSEPILRFVDSEGQGRSIPGYGSQLQGHAIANVPAEGTLTVEWTEVVGTYADGTTFTLRRPVLSVGTEEFGSLAGSVATGVRIGPPLIGLGLLEAIPEADIRSGADPDDLDGDGISGRVSTLTDDGTGTDVMGRFGLKANVATIAEQSASAYLLDLGITSPLLPDENCPSGQDACAAAPSGGAPEISADRMDAVILYLQTLAVPARVGWDQDSVVAGQGLFDDLGCAACHRPKWTTGDHDIAALSGQTIYPYTDLLLHDMGEALGDGRSDGTASPTEWRTAPLWGLGFTKAVNPDAGFLHDGRARTIEEAVLWHGGEAEASKQGFLTLSAAQREQLLHFLKSL